MKNQAQIRAEEVAQNYEPQPLIPSRSPSREEGLEDLCSPTHLINQPDEAPENSENPLTTKGDTTPATWNREEVQSSERQKRLRRLQRDALVTCGIPFQKRRVKPPEQEKMYAVKQFHGAQGRGSTESGKLQNSQISARPGQVGDSKVRPGGLDLLRELDQQTTPQIKEQSVTPSATPLKNEETSSLSNCKALLSPQFIQGQSTPNLPGSQGMSALPRPRYTIVTSPNYILNSPFRVERYENALSMTTQERLEHLGKGNYMQSQSLAHKHLSCVAGTPLQRRNNFGTPTLPTQPLCSPPLVKMPSTPTPTITYQMDTPYVKTIRPSVYESPFKQYQPANMNVGRWKQEEHHRFLEALRLYGREWKQVQQHVATRTSTQARSHAQKFLGKLEKRNITLQQFLDKYFERPDELEDDFFSGVQDNDMVYNRKKQFQEEKEQQAEQQQQMQQLQPQPHQPQPQQQPEPVPTTNVIIKQPRSYKEVQINGYTITPTKRPDFKDEIPEQPIVQSSPALNQAPAEESKDDIDIHMNQSDNKYDRLSDAYEGDDQFDAVVTPAVERRTKRKKGRPRKESNKIVLPTQNIPSANFQPFVYGSQNMGFQEGGLNGLNPQFYNPYDTEPYKGSNLVTRKAAPMDAPMSSYFPQQQQWQTYAMQQQQYMPSTMMKGDDPPAVSAIPPMGQGQSGLVAPPPPSAIDFQNFVQYGQNDLQIPEGGMQNMQQFEPPSVLNQQSVAAAMMYSQQMGRNQYGMYDLGGSMQEDYNQYQDQGQSNFYFPQQNYGQFNQYAYQNESLGDYSHQQTSPRNRTNSMPDAPPNHEQFLKRSGFGRPFDNSEDLGGSIAAGDQSIGPVKYSGAFDLNPVSKFKGAGEMKQGDDQIVAKD